jgi:Golgi nucleoside diphosphatase
MTFARLAQSLDVSERYLGFVINGQRQSPPLLQALRLHLGESAWRFVVGSSDVLDISELPPLVRSRVTP